MAMILLATGTAPAARLCRDTKGLFTPCIGAPPAAMPMPRRRDDAATPGITAVAHQDVERPDRGRRAARETGKPPLIAKTRLCRDTKGLFTPCPR